MKSVLTGFVKIILLFLVTTGAALAGPATVEAPASCVQCGMDRTRFDRSRTVITYADGSTAGLCSIHCAAADMKQHSGEVQSLLVADYATKKLIPARDAVWVVGGSRKGVMTSPAKWAFGSKKEALKFVAENGGEITPFDTVMRAVEDEVAEMDKIPPIE
jgi:nitrous oxide reductase accessory protein NosL